MNARTALLLLSGALAAGHPFFADVQAAAPCASSPKPAAPAYHSLGKPCTVTPWTPADDCRPPCGSACTICPCPSPCTCAPACCPQGGGRSWAVELDAAFLLWWTRSTPVPPLATNSDDADLGVIGAPSTVIVLGGHPQSSNPAAGARFAGRFLANEALGIAVGGFFLENVGSVQPAGGHPVLGVPIIDPADGANAAVRLAGPGSAFGQAALGLSSRLWGMDASALARAQLMDVIDLDLLAGFRFLQLNETLEFRTRTTTAVPGFFDGDVTPAGSTYVGLDRFGTRNNFYGGQVGVRASGLFGPFTAQVTASVALGSTRQTVNISGSTTLLAAGADPANAPGNIFTQQTNIGAYSRDRFGVIPQAGLAVGCQICDCARVTVGYDFLYWNNVARPGSQIDRVVNPSLPPILDDGTRLGEARPAPLLDGSDYWAQGLTFGLELAF